MAGHVHRHGNGWRAVAVDGYGRGAQRRIVGTFRRKADAENELRLAEAEMLTGTFVDRQLGKVSVVERMRADIERRSDRAHNTTVGALTALGHVEAFFGTKSIASTRHSDVQAFVSALDLAPSTVNTTFGHLKATFRQALADGVIGRDPTVKIRLPKAVGGDMVIPTDRDVERLHTAAGGAFSVAIILGAGVGLRAQECAGVVVDDIDFLRRELNVHRQWHGRLDRFEDLKTAGSARTIPVGDDILGALAAHLGEHGEGEHGVVLHDDGRPLNAGRMQWRWEVTKRGAGLEQLRYHSLRHHYASTAISAGVPLPALSRALGHTKASVTLDVYGHLMVDDSDRLRSATTARFGRREAS